MDRRNGTSPRRSEPPRDEDILVTYREFLPRPALRGHVRAYFSCTPGAPPCRGLRPVTLEVRFTRQDSFCAPLLADGRTSLALDLGATCKVGEGWTVGTPLAAHAIGAQRRVGGPAPSACAEMIGAYFEPGATELLLQVPAVELTDSIVDLDALWGTQVALLASDLAGLDEADRVDRLEMALFERLRRAQTRRSSVDVAGLARWARADPGAMTVGRLADAAGVSRQHLARVFREVIGVSPKRFCRLARFQATLAFAGAGSRVPWAQAAAQLGYADQSHMIAEFREMSSVTPEALAAQRWFHPFILEATARMSNRLPGAVGAADEL